MRNFRTAIISSLAIALTATSACSGQDASAKTATPAVRLDKGIILVAELTKGVNSKNAKSGATVKARVTQDVLVHGVILVRRDSKLIGHVTEAKASKKDDRESRLGIVFDRVLLKGGGEVDFQGILDAVAAPLPEVSRVDKPSEMVPPSLMGGSHSSSTPQPIGTGQASNPRSAPSSSTSNTSSRGIDTTGAASLPNQTPNTTAGGLSAGTHGVLGMKGVTLTNGNSSGTAATVLRSAKDDVKLEFGTQVVIQVTVEREL